VVTPVIRASGRAMPRQMMTAPAAASRTADAASRLLSQAVVSISRLILE
jgi:hypothetical protein